MAPKRIVIASSNRENRYLEMVFLRRMDLDKEYH